MPPGALFLFLTKYEFLKNMMPVVRHKNAAHYCGEKVFILPEFMHGDQNKKPENLTAPGKVKIANMRLESITIPVKMNSLKKSLRMQKPSLISKKKSPNCLGLTSSLKRRARRAHEQYCTKDSNKRCCCGCAL